MKIGPRNYPPPPRFAQPTAPAATSGPPAPERPRAVTFGRVQSDLEELLPGATLTLVFSDGCHREAWLEQHGMIPKAVNQNEYTDRDHARRSDHDRRRQDGNMTYVIGPVKVQR